MKMRHNKFTLVELLVVICIASLLMGVVLPAFNRMVTGSAVDRLASNLKLRLERAQAHAASSRRHVAVILPHGTGWQDTREQKARLGGSRMCYVDWNAENYTAAFRRWVPEEDWSVPERGAFLVYVTNQSGQIAAEGSVQPIGTNAGLDTVVNAGSNNAADKPLKDVTGSLRVPSGTPTADPVNSAIVFSPNGNVRSTADVYLVIAEAMVSGNQLIFPGGAVHNYRVLKINRVTGKVEYYR